MVDDIETRLERLERHVGVSATELAWEDYVTIFGGVHEEIIDTGIGGDYNVKFLAEGLYQKSDWKLNFGPLSVSPHNSELVEIIARAPDDWQEKLEKVENADG